MVASVTFENAAFADVVKKASSVAAAKGAAFDKAAGIVIEHDSVAGTRVRATNLDMYYTEWLEPALEANEDFVWRVSSRFLAAIAGGLPIGAGKTVTLTDAGTMVGLASGAIRSKLPKLKAELYPSWDVFDPSGLATVTAFADAVSAVQWAASKGSDVPMSGVHFDGEYAVATNRYVMGIMPLKLPLNEPVTVPAGVMASLVKANDTSGETFVGMSTDNNKFLVMPNAHSQMQLTTFGVPFIPYKKILEALGTSSLRVGKADLVALLQRTESLSNIDRNPKLTVIVGKESIAAHSLLSEHDGAMIGDIIECSGADHARKHFSFNPAYLIAAVSNATGTEVEITYHEDSPSKFWCIASDGGYQAWIVPRKAGE